MKKTLLIILLIFSRSAIAQDTDIDKTIAELTEKIKHSENGEKLKWLDSLSNIIPFDPTSKSDSIIKETLEFALKLDSIDIAVDQTANLMNYFNYTTGESKRATELYLSNQKHIARVKNNNIKCKFYDNASSAFLNLKEFDDALRMIDSVNHWATKGNNLRYIGLAKLTKGIIYTDMGEFGKASLSLQDAIRSFQKINDSSRVIDTRNSLAILYSKNNFFKEAKIERDQIINISLANNNYNILAVLYYNTAADNRKTGDEKVRIENLKKALEFARLSDYSDYFEPIMLSGLIFAYANVDSVAQANTYLKKLESNKEKNTTGIYKGYYLEAIKSLAFAKKDYQKAINYGEEYLSIMKESKQYEEIENGERFLAKIYETIGNEEKAFQHFKNYTQIKDSIGSAQNRKVLSYYQTLYETEKRDLQIEAQQSNISLLDSENKLKSQWLLFGGLGLAAIFGFVVLIRSRNTAKRRQVQQQKFTTQLVNTQEMERSRVAKELHDSIGQKLLILKNTLFLKKTLKTDETELLDETIKEVREMSHSLHPFQFEKLGLITSLENMITAFQKSSEVFYSSEIEVVAGSIPKEKEIFIFRMLQECISNVEKHAEATACNLSVFQKGKHVVFQLKDNGKGFNKSQEIEKNDSLGMKTLLERAHYINADFNIDSNIGKGTTVTIKIQKA